MLLATQVRRRFWVRGVVQGVGFRPFVYGLAHRHGLAGWVLNTSAGVQIDVEGGSQMVDAFQRELVALAPPLARIEGIEAQDAEPSGAQGFAIRESQAQEGRYQLVSPDIATCHACRREIFDPTDRRYRYPFTNCTNCGPRFTIIDDIPYDRPQTTMRAFRMCPACQAEYDDPLDRRFHAQPNACPVCGPQLSLVDTSGLPIPGDPLLAAAGALQRGETVALKGLGGFQLACDATSQSAVARLRQRKRRPDKPLAVMVSDLDAARRHCDLTLGEEALLSSPAAPIVLACWRPESTICHGVAPGIGYLGVMLPATPLHHLLAREAGVPLVMTSGNLSEEPIARDNEEALRRLAGIADVFLMHNRDIYSRYDDSVYAIEAGAARLVRRARGHAPFPIKLPFSATTPVLACGAELKNTFCLARDEYAFLSQHIGDLENLETLDHFRDTLALYQRLFRIKPEVIAHDLHPDYLATRFALEQPLPKVGVQHHHAHIVACMAENGVQDPVIGVALDGAGYGPDGTIWGGEFLLAEYGRYQRLGRLDQAPMPGGDLATHRPYRMAYGYLSTMLGDGALDLPFLAKIGADELSLMAQQLARGLNSPLTSSCGRLFDAVSALLGIRGVAGYEAQAAIELETLAANTDASLPFDISEVDGLAVIELATVFQSLVAGVRAGLPVPELAGRFHNTVVAFCVAMCHRLRQSTGIGTVALSGGVFQNRRIFRQMLAALQSAGFTVLTHRLVPCNDGGISLGQAVVACYSSS
jgi:hydrogenase maturation protein HypF